MKERGEQAQLATKEREAQMKAAFAEMLMREKQAAEERGAQQAAMLKWAENCAARAHEVTLEGYKTHADMLKVSVTSQHVQKKMNRGRRRDSSSSSDSS